MLFPLLKDMILNTELKKKNFFFRNAGCKNSSLVVDREENQLIRTILALHDPSQNPEGYKNRCMQLIAHWDCSWDEHKNEIQ